MEETAPDATMVRIGKGIELGQRGERAAARVVFTQTWEDIGGENGDPFHRCALAHSMADVQDDVHAELLWDLRALDAVDDLTDERAAEAGVRSSVAAFYPSLHLNLGDCYRRLGDIKRAAHHLALGCAATDTLPDEGYSRLIKDGLARLAERLGADPVTLPGGGTVGVYEPKHPLAPDRHGPPGAGA